MRSGLIDRIKASLEQVHVSYVTLGGVVPNPHLSLVYEGIELCKKENVDFILAVGEEVSLTLQRQLAMEWQTRGCLGFL